MKKYYYTNQRIPFTTCSRTINGRVLFRCPANRETSRFIVFNGITILQ